jgi:hypothetical protein
MIDPEGQTPTLNTNDFEERPPSTVLAVVTEVLTQAGVEFVEPLRNFGPTDTHNEVTPYESMES